MKVLPIFALCALASVPAFAAEKTVAPSITAVRAQLFYDLTGKLSDDLLAKKDLSLFNTIIDGENASNSTLITVEVSGQNIGSGAVKVELIATDDKKKVLGATKMDVALYDAKTKFFAPLMLTNTGCNEISITARLLGKGAPKGDVKKTIPFLCGE